MAKMFIGGELVDSVTKETYEIRNPANGTVVDSIPKGNEKDVQQAIQAAEAAFKEWADVTPEDRGSALMNACELLKKNTSEIAQLLTQEQGKTLFEAGLEIHHLVHGLEFYAGLASKVRGAHVPLPQKGAYGMVIRQPIGVCGGIVPWNFPLTLMGTKLGPALAAGNSIIINSSGHRTHCPSHLWRRQSAKNIAEGNSQRRHRPRKQCWRRDLTKPADSQNRIHRFDSGGPSRHGSGRARNQTRYPGTRRQRSDDRHGRCQHRPGYQDG
jgi:acyl-CoA reductase-like NAD-dependent aldehyde dehydrogenase